MTAGREMKGWGRFAVLVRVHSCFVLAVPVRSCLYHKAVAVADAVDQC
jgi:hypothetical protein